VRNDYFRIFNIWITFIFFNLRIVFIIFNFLGGSMKIFAFILTVMIGGLVILLTELARGTQCF